MLLTVFVTAGFCDYETEISTKRNLKLHRNRKCNISCNLNTSEIFPTVEDGTDRWSRNVGKELPLLAA
jgi:hypothetical protein